jgi:hypothetical protein
MMQRLRHFLLIRIDTFIGVFNFIDDFAYHLYARLREIHLSIHLGENLVEG